ncbi:MAG: hypothetical protein JWO86_8262 [Myxococcaceae bacterium]|nr:hypothetical protein [Myxococcaceae bacterium]
MLKAVYPALAALALLFAALAGGWGAAPSGPFASRTQQHATSHDPTSFEDDDGDRDDDGLECSVLAAERADDDDQDDADADADGDGNALQPIAAREFPPLVVTVASSMTRWGLRPSGEHRDAADRPPRA